MLKITCIYKRMWMRLLLLLPCLALLFFVCVSWIYAQRLTRARPCAIGAAPKSFPYACENITLTTSDQQTLSGWFVPGEEGKGAIILLHGYTGNRLQMADRALFFRKQGYGVLLYDARACGESTGEVVTFGYRERHDLLAAVRFLKKRGIDKIACLGISQGGATILYAAEDLDDVKCVICESAYDDMAHAVDRRMRHYTGMPGWIGASAMVPFAEQRLGLTMDEMKPSDHIGALKCPVLIISGDQDDRTWPEDTQRLFEAAHEPRELWMIAGARHEDLFRYLGYEEKVLSFVKRHFE
jgi:uncharacterized protein